MDIFLRCLQALICVPRRCKLIIFVGKRGASSFPYLSCLCFQKITPIDYKDHSPLFIARAIAV